MSKDIKNNIGYMMISSRLSSVHCVQICCSFPSDHFFGSVTQGSAPEISTAVARDAEFLIGAPWRTVRWRTDVWTNGSGPKDSTGGFRPGK